MEKENFEDQVRDVQQGSQFRNGETENNPENNSKDQSNSAVTEDKEREILEDSEKENYAEQAENLHKDGENIENDDNSSEKEEVDELSSLQQELQESKDKYIRLYSEFDNFRRRTAKERLELVKTANEDLVLALLSVVDDFERASKAIGEKEEADGVKEGIQLIHNKFVKVLEQKGLKPMGDLRGQAFDADNHEAITQIPAPEEKLKGKIVDVIENGYYLHDKVIRYAKVVIGA